MVAPPTGAEAFGGGGGGVREEACQRVCLCVLLFSRVCCLRCRSMMMISLINVYPKGVKALPKKKKAE